MKDEKKVILHGQIQAFGDDDLASLIDGPALAAAKQRAPKGIAKAFTVAHEGVTTPRVLSDAGPVTLVLKWGARAVEAVRNAVTTGIQCFAGNHSSDNSHEGRKPVAEIIGKGLRVVNGKLHAIAVAWFQDPNDSAYDVISLESPRARWNEDGNVEDIEPVTGFAVGRSGQQRPAFPEARLLAAIQCFLPEENNGEQKRQEKKAMTIEEVKRAIADNGWSPTTLFDSNSILGSIEISDGTIKIEGGDARVTKILEKKISEFVVVPAKEYAKAKEAIEFKAKVEPEVQNFRKTKFASEVSDKIKAKAKDAGWSESQVQYLLRSDKLDSISPSDNVDEVLRTYTEQTLASYKNDAEFFKGGKPGIENPATKVGPGLPSDKPYLDI